MKIKHLIVITGLLLLSRSGFAQDPVVQQNFKKLEWLCGKWTRTGMRAGHAGLENWYKVSASTLKGSGFSLKERDTVFAEQLELLIKDGAIQYMAHVRGHNDPVYFKVTEVNDKGFVCENQEHDFPKKIIYRLTEQGMLAVISGNGKQYDFTFIRAGKTE